MRARGPGSGGPLCWASRCGKAEQLAKARVGIEWWRRSLHRTWKSNRYVTVCKLYSPQGLGFSDMFEHADKVLEIDE